MTNLSARHEIQAGERFAFGDNWQRFLDLVDDARVRAAEKSLRHDLGDIAGKSFLDVGSGSGLFSLAARNLGARVTSFDYDPQSVECTRELQRRFRPADVDWKIELGSALDTAYLSSLGQFELVYSWGVLHHTGDMWRALGNVTTCVAPGGTLYISIYNDQGRASRDWRRVKRMYNDASPLRRRIIVKLVGVYFSAKASLGVRTTIARLRGRLTSQTAPERVRGMDRRLDLIDWVGGYPFEVAKPEQIFDFYSERGFALRHLRTCGGGLGCNEYVFTLS